VKKATSTIILNAADMTISRATIDGKAVPFKLDNDAQQLTLTLPAPAKLGNHVITFAWTGNQLIIHTASSDTVTTGFEVFQFTDGTVHNWSFQTYALITLRRAGTSLQLFKDNIGKEVWVRGCEAKNGRQHYAAAGSLKFAADGVLRQMGQLQD